MTNGYRANLPDPFPDKEDEVIQVSDESHLYEVFKRDGGGKLPKYEYELDKAPVIEVKEVSGTSDGKQKTFVEGDDYSLTPFTSERIDTLTFQQNRSQYALTTAPDSNSTFIEDENGNTFTEDIDFKISDKNVVDWSIGGSQPASGTSFTVTYDVTFENSYIDWDQDGDKPDAGSYFYVTYNAVSIISRYIQSADEELGNVSDELDNVINSKFVNRAKGEELDRLGAIFGELGKRDGRSDSTYRTYLRSVVKSIISRGTKNDIKKAVSASAVIDLDEIVINEDFNTNSYEIVINNWEQHNPDSIYALAEIADASGVELLTIKYSDADDELKTSSDVVDSVVATNTSLLRWDSNDYDDTLVYDDLTPGDLLEVTDDIFSEVTIRTSKQYRYDELNYGEFNYNGSEITDEVTESQDTVSEKISTGANDELETSSDISDSVVATNTSMVRWDSQRYDDILKYDDTTPGDSLNTSDDVFHEITISTSTPYSYDEYGYDEFSYNANEVVDEIAESKDVVSERVDVDGSIQGFGSSTVTARWKDLTQFVNEEQSNNETILSDVNVSEEEITESGDIVFSDVNTDPGSSGLLSSDSITTSIEELIVWSGETWDEAVWA